jgi:hypothetical protein
LYAQIGEDREKVDRTYDIYPVMDLMCCHCRNIMNESTKPILRLLCTISASWVSAAVIGSREVQAQPKPANPPATKPAATTVTTTYSFFQGLTFQPYPGTIPRAAISGENVTPALYPIVEVPTPGLVSESSTPRRNTVRRKPVEETPAPVRRRRRVVKPE